jgi:hypothetical protein
MMMISIMILTVRVLVVSYVATAGTDFTIKVLDLHHAEQQASAVPIG